MFRKKWAVLNDNLVCGNINNIQIKKSMPARYLYIMIKKKIVLVNINCPNASNGLAEKGFVTLKSIFTPQQCEELIGLNNQPIYYSAINIARYEFGLGEYKYFNYPLTNLIQSLRTGVLLLNTTHHS